jgi:DNA-binding NarL/FixJ family response regulator
MSVEESTGSPAEVGESAPDGARGGFRVLLAERRANAHSELSRRLTGFGHEVLARVTSGQAAIDYAALLRPDVVLVAPVLEDTAGVLAALNVTRQVPGVAAVVLTCHPAAADPAARPNWGAVALVPADAEPGDLEAEMRGAVSRARAEAVLASVAIPAATESAFVEEAVQVEVEASYSLESDYQTDVATPPTIPTPEDGEQALQGGYVVHDTPAEPPAADGSMTALVQSLWQASAEGIEAGQQQDVREQEGYATVSESYTTSMSEAAATELPAQADGPAQAGEPSEAEPAAGHEGGFGSEDELIRAAVDALVERIGIGRADAVRLMEQEATDLSQTMEEVARAVLGEPSGEMTTVA